MEIIRIPVQQNLTVSGVGIGVAAIFGFTVPLPDGFRLLGFSEFSATRPSDGEEGSLLAVSASTSTVSISFRFADVSNGDVIAFAGACQVIALKG